jgi:hypothetical protein
LHENGVAALATLDALSAADPEVNSKLADVMRRFVAMRDDLITARRAGAGCGEELARMNGILSSIFGMEFPSEGLQWQRVCETREALRGLLQELNY